MCTTSGLSGQFYTSSVITALNLPDVSYLIIDSTYENSTRDWLQVLILIIKKNKLYTFHWYTEIDRSNWTIIIQNTETLFRLVFLEVDHQEELT